jgi:hypothetical protein
MSVGDLVREATNLLEVLVDEKGQRLVVNRPPTHRFKEIATSCGRRS